MPTSTARNAEDRRRGVDRIIAFSDAVAAIAATLLILPLVDVATDIGHERLARLLSDNTDKLFVFVLSFAVICRFWLVHHAMYEHVVDYTPGLIRINFVWLLSIAFLPFPTQIIGATTRHDPLSFVLYIGTMLVTTAAGAASQWIIVRSPNVEPQAAQAEATIVPALITTVAMALALVIAVAVPQIGIWALLLLVVGGFIEDVYLRRRKRPPHTESD
jgi:uncharacterized membrane protein